jgi:hypothetical protein
MSARRPATMTEVFRVFFSVPLGDCQDNTFTLGYNCILPNPFQFIIHVSSSNSTRYILGTEKSSSNKLQNKQIIKLSSVLMH